MRFPILVRCHLYIELGPRAPSQYKDHLSVVGVIPMLKLRRSWDHLIFNMGIPILVKQHILRQPPWWCPSQRAYRLDLDFDPRLSGAVGTMADHKWVQDDCSLHVSGPGFITRPNQAKFLYQFCSILLPVHWCAQNFCVSTSQNILWNKIQRNLNQNPKITFQENGIWKLFQNAGHCGNSSMSWK